MQTAAIDERGERRADSRPSALGRLFRAIANPFKRRPDLSLANEKFTDAFERELAGQGYRKGY